MDGISCSYEEDQCFYESKSNDDKYIQNRVMLSQQSHKPANLQDENLRFENRGKI